jgi:protein-L-isoaspartate(D-aspartate) O-methyltransferase
MTPSRRLLLRAAAFSLAGAFFGRGLAQDRYAAARENLLREIENDMHATARETGYSTLSAAVRRAIATVARERFVPAHLAAAAYENRPLPIGEGQTISQPFIVALMTDLLDIQPNDTVLEVGTGLGYQAAIVAALARKVYSIELIEELSEQASQRLTRLGFANIELKIGNGSYGWAEHAPFDKVIVTAAPDLIPPPLIDQLKPGGKMAIPAGLPDAQQLILIEKDTRGNVTTRDIIPVRFSQLEGSEPNGSARIAQ